MREQIAEERATREGRKRARLIAENAGSSGGASAAQDQYVFQLWNAGQANATDVHASIVDEAGDGVAGPTPVATLLRPQDNPCKFGLNVVRGASRGPALLFLHASWTDEDGSHDQRLVQVQQIT